MSDLPRLLLCVFDVVPAPSAVSRRVTEYIKGLSDRYQVVVLSVKTPDHTHIERYQGARLLRVPVGSGDLAARVQAFDRAVRRQLDSEEYVMVHFFDPFGGYALCERRQEFGYKLVYDACTLPSVDLPFLYGEVEANRRFIARVRRQELFCLMNADVVIVANDLTRDFVTGLGVSREQVQVLPAPVDLGPYEPKLMGPPTGQPMRLVHLGNQSSAQDLSTLLEALALALQTVEVQLAILGPKHDEHQARLEEQVTALGLQGKVEFQPPVAHDDLHKVLATADVGLLTLADVERNSRVGSPLSRLGEYLAAGRPVIAADVASARALLPEDGVVLYRPQDKQSLADAICSLASEPARRVRLGAAARAAALDRDGAKVRADLVAIYVALTGTGVRAVGDADATTPDEITQLGRGLDSEETQRRKAEKSLQDPPSGTNKVKTDPAIAAAEETSPEAAAGADRPAIMGVPLREEEPPVVLGQEMRDVAAELAQVTTEPNAQRHSEPPVVMGMPVASGPALSSPTAPTPGDLAAELGEIDARPTAPPPPSDDEPRPLDDVPPTGPHLSLVPAPIDEPFSSAPTQPPTAPPAEAAQRPAPGLSEPVEDGPTKPPAPGPSEPSNPPVPGLSEPVEDGPAKHAGPSSSEPVEPTKPPVPGLSTPAEHAPPGHAAPGPSAPPDDAPASPPAPGLSEPVEAGPAKQAPAPGLSAPVERAPADDRAGSRPPPPPAPAPPSAPLFIPPLEIPPLAVPPLPAAPAVRSTSSSQPIAPLEMPPLPSSGSGLRPSSTSLPRTSSGVLPIVPPPMPSSRPSGTFAIAGAPGPVPASPSRTSSGLMPALSPGGGVGVAPSMGAGRTGSGLMPAVTAPPALLASPSNNSTGPGPSSAATSPSTAASSAGTPAAPDAPGAAAPGAPAKSRHSSSGLFPTAPSVPASPPRLAASPASTGPEEISESEIQEVEDGPEEIGDEEVLEAGEPEESETPSAEELIAPEESVMTVDTDPSPPPSAIDPWLAQLVHGYCPPESGLFERHTPPTTMPGRDT